jgi:hypothetical protein
MNKFRVPSLGERANTSFSFCLRENCEMERWHSILGATKMQGELIRKIPPEIISRAHDDPPKICHFCRKYAVSAEDMPLSSGLRERKAMNSTRSNVFVR